MPTFLLASTVVGLVAAIGLALLVWRVRSCLGSNVGVPARIEHWLKDFRSAEEPSQAAYEKLFCYFVEGFVHRRSPLGANARYAGWPSFNGPACDRLEGFSRFVPFIGGWLHGGRSPSVALSDGKPVMLPDLIRSGVLAGTDPSGAEYWGAIGHRDQRIVEAADVALALWLSRDAVWAHLDPGERKQVAAWLYGVNGKKTADNNWHLFVVIVNVVLGSLGMPFERAETTRRYERFKSFYRGAGWFSDGPEDKFDYYAAWGIHYPLWWIRRIDPTFDPGFLRQAGREFAATYKFFFGPRGFPIMGRSACYRIAAPAPLVQAQHTDPDVVTPGEARRALDLTWRHFIGLGALCAGNVTQGYGRADPRILDNYSGPASCLWSLRSLVAAFSEKATTPFWRSSADLLPVESMDIKIHIAPAQWTVYGVRESAEIVIVQDGNSLPAPARLAPYRIVRRLRDIMMCRAGRPDNTIAKYAQTRYSNIAPFGSRASAPVSRAP
jgi:hypothetical protein